MSNREPDGDGYAEKTPQDLERVIVAGSRSISDRDVVSAAIRHSPHSPFHGTLISGGADGVDAVAKQIAESYVHIDYKEFEAEWDAYGSAAGPIRNQRMADYADALIAVWDGESAGTKNMIENALERGLNVYVEVHEPCGPPQEDSA